MRLRVFTRSLDRFDPARDYLVATELVICSNYVFAVICVTPMALLMTSLATPSASAGMPMARVLDTVLGALVGVAFALVFSTLDDRAHLAAHHAKARAG